MDFIEASGFSDLVSWSSLTSTSSCKRPMSTGDGLYIYHQPKNGDLVGGLEHEVIIFPYIGKNNPNTFIFFRGLETTNQ